MSEMRTIRNLEARIQHLEAELERRQNIISRLCDQLAARATNSAVNEQTAVVHEYLRKRHVEPYLRRIEENDDRAA